MNKKIEKFGKLIKKAEKILLINHIRMDPDAFGSLGAFYYILKKIGKDVKATNDFLPPENFSFLESSDIIETGIDIAEFNPDLIISFDAASIGQLGETYIKYENIFKQKDFVVIDHHMTNSGFGSINIIDDKYSSTCELAFDIIEKLDLDKYITKKIATLLTAGIHTDTNIFYNQNTSSHTLRIAAKLMDFGADFRSTMYNFFQKSSWERTKLFGFVFDKMKKSEDGKIIWAIITKKDFKKTKTGDEDTSGIINRLINIDGVEIAFLLHELGDEVKASFRSKEFSVGDFCASFGGGGHMLAAGFRSKKNIIEVEKEILDKLGKKN
ncbi:bifunctional oligoribonuclease/PAP phosphatase NrnA [Candidatus Gracilibacteria bacterium]|nr:bifunctional oligoribonuclease/PAP phosphatase NrnA [Candidatus Gracilibacteria bacterium]